ncbi:MAG TPA: ABC transporter ATP-binding protein [Thiotrichaceae bacterium]|jgi:putative ABC transport system ATP-binding protein|nr:ABC transporter ATP-binding protein [Thiotrichaceae bacterium]
MLKLIDIHKSYKIGPTDLAILQGVDLEVFENDMLAIMGTSGSGKSTLMNIIGLLDKPTSGTYLLDDKEIMQYSDDELSSKRNEKIGFVFQQFNLLSRLTALENVCIPLIYRDTPTAIMHKQAMSMLKKVGMDDRADHRPNELSGGQQQRVAIARALVGKPALILADEPTGALDTRVGAEIMELFKTLNRDEGITIVIITHDPGIAEQCPRYVIMQDGKLVEKNLQNKGQAA